METFQPWRTSSIARLTNIYHGSNKHDKAWELAGIPKAGPRSTPAFWTSFYWRQEVTDVPLYPLQKKLHGKYILSILHLYLDPWSPIEVCFKGTS